MAYTVNIQEEDYWMATLEEMADPRSLRALREAQEDSATGRVLEIAGSGSVIYRIRSEAHVETQYVRHRRVA